ncbi:MAG: hypothetical protein WBQ05_15090 [Candidatus Competibacter denitrificans]
MLVNPHRQAICKPIRAITTTPTANRTKNSSAYLEQGVSIFILQAIEKN